ncbi:MAG TPA: NAD-dependent epimerase/dehydratase family protein, partial [Sphingomicrobium sp.]
DDRIVITGANGWIGRAALEMLHDTLGAAAFGSRVVPLGSAARSLTLRSGLTVTQHPLADIAQLPKRPTLLLHTAFLTLDRAKAMAEASYIAANEEIRAMVLAAVEPIGVTATFLPSSGAVYADGDCSAAMQLYGRLKMDDEAAFASAGRTIVARVFNLSGRHINKHSSYALASFINDALAGRPITIQADKPVVRSYVPVADLLSVAVGLLTDGSMPAPFDTAGPAPIEIGEVAEVVASVVGCTDIVRPQLSAGAPDRYVGNRDAYASHLATQQVSETSFASQIGHTADFLSEIMRRAA